MSDEPKNKSSQGKKGGGGGQGAYRLTVPIDASQVEDRGDVETLKVVGRDGDGRIQGQTVELDADGQGSATLSFDEHPGRLKVYVGPGDAGDEELPKLQTLQYTVAGRQWAGEQELELAPVEVPLYYWRWWLTWCRTFEVRGRVICPDGSPVPGAEVCAFDVDWFFIWSSSQKVACATTDINGTFSMEFRWCCGWWPWWWWRNRVWRLNDELASRIQHLARRNPSLDLGAIRGDQPSLASFRPLLEGGRAGDVDITSMNVEAVLRKDVGLLKQFRERLVTELPPAPELEQFHVWPWWPWWPWWDCTPDLIFEVTQDCAGVVETIVDEDVSDTRWNVSDPLTVTLVANEEACCRPLPCQEPPCHEGECIIIDRVCQTPLEHVGGNGAVPTPAGYLNPGSVSANTEDDDRPFGGIVPVYKNPGDLLGVDYLEFEYSDDGGTTWKPLPAGAGVDFTRLHWDTGISPPSTPAPFNFDSTSFPGHTVLETREHREGVIGGTWDVPGADHWWLSMNWDLLIPIDSTVFPDGTYHFRVIGWNDGGGGNLVNRTEIPVCGKEDELNRMVLTFDNRAVTPVGHDPSHFCGGIHVCTVEPDTHILEVRINGTSVGPCDTIDASTGTLEVKFLVVDTPAGPGQPGHLGSYFLQSRWGLNQSRHLLDKPSANVTAISGGPSGWRPGQKRGNYGTAVVHQGAVPPDWSGGTFVLEMDVQDAFPEPCCYQLHLGARKRTVLGRKSGLGFSCHGRHWNRTQYHLGVGVCAELENEQPLIE